ncbi:MAG: hypothetical protein ACE5FA_07800 [Dehalococcoidia bacterium]
MFRRWLEAWERVTKIRADADIKIARIQAKAARFAVKAKLGMLQKDAAAEPRSPEMDQFERWAGQHLEPGPQRDDARGMYEIVLGLRDATPEKKRKSLARLTRMGVPLPGEPVG